MEPRCVKQDLLCDDLLKELATALQEGDWPVCLGNAVVWFARFQDRDDNRTSPGVVAPEDSGVEQRGQAGGRGRMTPLEEFIGNLSGAWS